MNQFDLTRICDPACKYYDLSRPWVFGGWRYATNGMIAVRVSAEGETDTVAEKTRQPGFPKAHLEFEKQGFSLCRSRWKQLDKEAACSQCFGSGEQQQECQACKGSGCKRCDQRGVRAYADSSVCLACLGTGATPADQKIGPQKFAGWLLEIVQSVPGCRYKNNRNVKEKDHPPLVFIGDGGLQGLLMPLDAGRKTK